MSANVTGDPINKRTQTSSVLSLCLDKAFNKKGCSVPDRVSILQEGWPHCIHQSGLLSSQHSKIKSMSETRDKASTAATEIENLVLLSANDISTFLSGRPPSSDRNTGEI